MSRRRDSDEPANDGPAGEPAGGEPVDDGCDHDGEISGLPPEWGPIVVPDDLRALEAEVREVRAELAATRRAARSSYGRLFGRTGRAGLTGPFLALVLFLIAAIGSLMVVVLPKSSRPPRREPLANPTISVGTAGGLVPPITLSGDGRSPTSLREFRPAVLLISPAACATCATVRNQLVVAAVEAQLTVVWITESDQSVAVPPGAAETGLVSLADPSGVTRLAVTGASTTGPTAVLIRADGRIGRVVADVADPDRLRPEFAALTIR